jgi:hypothetical protein
MSKTSRRFILNSIFTVALFFCIFTFSIISKSYYKKQNNNSKLITLSSDFQNHKIQILDKSEKNFYNIHSNNPDLYKEQPNFTVTNVVNHNNIPKDNIEIDEILQNIIHKNPLVQYSYVQIGIFTSQDVIDKLLTLLSNKKILNEDATIYIEEKNIEGNKSFVVEIGAFKDNKEAVQFCDTLSTINIGCIVLE